MSQLAFAAEENHHLVSHTMYEKVNIEKEKERIQNATSLTLSRQETLELLEQVNEFDLGRFLLEKKGLDGFWTAHVILRGPQQRHFANALEEWVYLQAPVVRATQERFRIFQKEIQSRLSSRMTLASLPCGLMDDLLMLNYEGLKDVNLVGIDLDPDSLELAEQNVSFRKTPVKVGFLHKDAWHLKVKEKYDLLTSNGLNIYVPEDDKVIELYQKMHRALKVGGILVTSFLTPPPTMTSDSPWIISNPQDLLKQKALFGDVLQVKWQTYRTEKQTREQLEKAGFHVLDVIYDSQGMFPTVVAEKK